MVIEIQKPVHIVYIAHLFTDTVVSESLAESVAHHSLALSLIVDFEIVHVWQVVDLE